ncbi:hypothetical protein KKF59_03155 [Patescibacteria group bacterium]|nr:hypothetical protein [Patescibacteria group bacterium]
MEEYSKQLTEQVLKALFPKVEEKETEGQKLSVHETISRFSFLYERIRNAVDYKDEHLIRKAAILRILKRLLILEANPEALAGSLIKELIGARYLPNGQLPDTVVKDVALLVQKYQAVARINAGSERHLEWLRGVLSVEIEETLVDQTKEKALVMFLYERVIGGLRVDGMSMEETERRLQVYVACYRSLIKADDEMLGYKLLRAYLPEWLDAQDWLINPRPIAERLVAIERRIKLRLRHKLSQQFLRAIKPYAVSLGLLRDALPEDKEQAAELLNQPDQLAVVLDRTAEERYAKARGKLRRGTMRAIVYLFFTKMLVALLLEVPLEWLWYKGVNKVALGINLLFPPLLMFFVGLLIRVPGPENTAKLKSGVDDLLSEGVLKIKNIKAPKMRNKMTTFWFTLAYISTFILSFGLTISVLRTLAFTWLSVAIFIFFLCVVSFFAFRLRTTAREVVVIEGKQGFFSMLVDFYSFPILRAGKWLSRSINRINVFLFIFDFLFEAPFKLFLVILEEWFAFMKEKKEEL